MDYLSWLTEREVFEVLKGEALDLIGDFSMNVYGLAFIKNEIVLNKRVNLLEFGSGLSTIFMAMVVKKYGIDAKVTSVESDIAWADRINGCASRMQLSSIVNIIHAPLIKDSSVGLNNQWYDQTILSEKIIALSGFDMVVIDGPPAYRDDIALSRFMAVPFIMKFLGPNFSIFLDDADRSGEMRVLEMWKQQFNLVFNIYNRRTALCRSGVFINSHPSFLNKMI